MSVDSVGYRFNTNNYVNNGTFKGSAYNNQPNEAKSTAPKSSSKKEQSTFQKALTFCSIAGIGALGAYYGGNAIKSRINLSELSKKLGDVSELKGVLAGRSLNFQRKITNELIKTPDIVKENAGKIKDLIEKISKDKNIRKESIVEEIIESIIDFPLWA